MNHQHWILTVGWILFGLLHSVTASAIFKNNVQRLIGGYFKYYRIGYSIFAFVSMSMILLYQFSVTSILLLKPTAIINIIALCTAAISSAGMGFCIYQYFYRLSGIAAINHKAANNTLKTDGLNRYMRHPLYTATLLFIWSLLLLFPLLSNLLACIAITLYTLTGIHFEEKKLAAAFGKEYLYYKSTVPMLIPRFRNDRKVMV